LMCRGHGPWQLGSHETDVCCW